MGAEAMKEAGRLRLGRRSLRLLMLRYNVLGRRSVQRQIGSEWEVAGLLIRRLACECYVGRHSGRPVRRLAEQVAANGRRRGLGC